MLPTEIKVGHCLPLFLFWHLASPTTASRSAGFGTAPISAGISSRTTSLQVITEWEPQTEPRRRPARSRAPTFAMSRNPANFWIFRAFSC